MKVGVLQLFGWRDRSIPLEDVYARALDRVELANAIFEHLEIFHNRRRRHSSLGMVSPIE